MNADLSAKTSKASESQPNASCHSSLPQMESWTTSIVSKKEVTREWREKALKSYAWMCIVLFHHHLSDVRALSFQPSTYVLSGSSQVGTTTMRRQRAITIGREYPAASRCRQCFVIM